MVVMFSAFLGMNLLIFVRREGHAVPRPAFYIASTCGVIALCAFWAFQEGIKKGKIATSWLIINLSSAIPTIGSILIYHEPINLKKIAIVALIFMAIVLVWKDGLEDQHRLERKVENDLRSALPVRSGDTPFEREM
jgi:drug/metabolite transporter (DMT)-like permease